MFILSLCLRKNVSFEKATKKTAILKKNNSIRAAVKYFI